LNHLVSSLDSVKFRQIKTWSQNS